MRHPAIRVLDEWAWATPFDQSSAPQSNRSCAVPRLAAADLKCYLFATATRIKRIGMLTKRRVLL